MIHMAPEGHVNYYSTLTALQYMGRGDERKLNIVDWL